MTDAIAAMIPMLAATLLHAARPQARYAVACGA